MTKAISSSLRDISVIAVVIRTLRPSAQALVWLLDDKVRTLPPHAPTAAEVVAVFGDYANAGGVSELPYARKEADFLAQHDGEKVEATRQAIVSLLQDGRRDGWIAA